MAKIKYTIGKKYTLKLRDIEIKDIVYDGIYDDYNCMCDLCGKEIWNPHFFIGYENGTPSYTYHFGSECIKKVVIS